MGFWSGVLEMLNDDKKQKQAQIQKAVTESFIQGGRLDRMWIQQVIEHFLTFYDKEWLDKARKVYRDGMGYADIDHPSAKIAGMRVEIEIERSGLLGPQLCIQQDREGFINVVKEDESIVKSYQHRHDDFYEVFSEAKKYIESFNLSTRPDIH